MASAMGPVPDDWTALGLVKQVVLPGKHGVAAPADAVSVNTAFPGGMVDLPRRRKW